MASTSSTLNKEYVVFLSFRGADTRNNFTSHLYNALRKEGVKAFMDKELQRGEEISSTLFLIIENSQVSIVIFSPNYASSKFCLDELVKILDCRASRQQVVLPVFYSVDPFEVEKQTGRYGRAILSHESEFKRLIYGEKTIEEKMEKLQRWKSALAEAADLSGWDLHNRDEAEVIQDIVKSVLHKLNREHLKNQIEGELVLDAHQRSNAHQRSKEVLPEVQLVGKSFQCNFMSILKWLHDDDVSSIGIWGMGGAGKTTLAIHIYNYLLDKPEISGDQVYWVSVYQDFSVHKLQNLIAKEIELEFETEGDVMKRAAKLYGELLSKGKFVLILDDLWNHFDMKRLAFQLKSMDVN